MSQSIYLDNAATTRLSDPMQQYLASILNLWGNPSSLHSIGEPAKQLISEARRSVADLINTTPNNIYFTPSGSASNTCAIKGYYSKHNCIMLYSPIAHKSILKCAESYHNRQPLKVDLYGMIDIPDLEGMLNACNAKPLVVIDHANSEIATIQNIHKIIRTVHLHDGIVYLDCTGSIPQIPIDVTSLDIDMIGFSAHKLGGLKGCGVLYRKSSIELEPLIYGSQQDGLIAGTENVLGIASLGKAAQEYDYSSVSPANRDYVYDYIIKNIPNSYLVGAAIESGNRLPHNLYMCFQGVEGEALMILLDMNGIQVSTGSACNSGSISASAALTAIGMNEEDIHSCIRLSFNGQETKEELDYVCETLSQCITSLRRLNRQ